LVPEKEIEAMRAAGPPAREYTIGGGNGELRLIEKLIRERRGGYVHFESEQLSITLSREST
jgi:hypothetical protein